VHRFNACADVTSSIIRFISSPPLAPHTLDELSSAFDAGGEVLGAKNDHDINASVVSALVSPDAYGPTLEGVAARFSTALVAGRAFRVEFLTSEPEAVSEDALRSLAVALHGAFSAPVYVARRNTPAAAWAFVRPMPWGRKGLAVGQTAPTLPFGGSECLGVAIEVGKPTILAKARLEGVPEHGLREACAAVGGGDSGFAEVGAYPAVSAADGASVVVLEFGDAARSPMHRTLSVLDIEAKRFGGRLGQTALLSHFPLDAMLDVLRSRTGLAATASQVLETHLPRDRAR